MRISSNTCWREYARWTVFRIVLDKLKEVNEKQNMKIAELEHRLQSGIVLGWLIICKLK